MIQNLKLKLLKKFDAEQLYNWFHGFYIDKHGDYVSLPTYTFRSIMESNKMLNVYILRKIYTKILYPIINKYENYYINTHNLIRNEDWI